MGREGLTVLFGRLGLDEPAGYDGRLGRDGRLGFDGVEGLDGLWGVVESLLGGRRGLLPSLFAFSLSSQDLTVEAAPSFR